MTLASGGRSPEALAGASAEYLLIRVGSRDFAIPCSPVRIICPRATLLPAPTAWKCFAGLLTVGGEAVPAIDLGVQIQASAVGRPTCAVVFEPDPPIPLLPLLAILVDKVVDTARVRSSDVVPPRRVSFTCPFVRGTWHGRSRTVYLIDLGGLVASLPFTALQDGRYQSSDCAG